MGDPDALRLDGPPSLEELAGWAQGGVRRLSVPLHGARPEVHDWVAGVEGAFAATVRALEAARGLGLAITAETALTRSNARVLVALPSLLRARGVRGWRVRVPTFEDDAALVGRAARLTLALPAALSALDRARALGIEVTIEGAPRCLLGPMDAIAEAGPARAHPPPCEGCGLRAGCPGIDARYAARFGDGELRPR